VGVYVKSPLIPTVFTKKGNTIMTKETNKDDINNFHDRANHEDILHTRRLGLFLSFNGFLVVAIGFQVDDWLKILFASVGLVFNIFWLIWSRNAGVFIRALRDAGKLRADQVLWIKKIRKMDYRLGGVFSPQRIMNFWLPILLISTWIVTIIYFGLNYSNQELKCHF
jgi:hypothetical protein